MSDAAESVDAVIVGAGPNGLVAANLLADAGWQVLVLEAQDEIGGAVKTAELIEPGFRNDRFSAFYPLGAASPVLRALDLEQHGLRWKRAPAPLAHVLPDDDCVLLAADPGETMASLASFAESDADAWATEFAEWCRIRDDLITALLSPFPPVRGAARLLRRMGAADLLRFGRMTTMPVRAFAEERFAGEGARVLLAGNALHTDLGPGHAGSAVFGWILCMLAQDVGFPVPEGGAGRLTAAMAARLTAKGGRIQCGRAVTRILTARGRAVGVADAEGGLVRARKAVLATVPAPTLYLELLDAADLPQRLLRDLRGFHWDDGTVKVDWALSGPIPWANPRARRAGTVHLDGDTARLARFSADLAAGRTPAQPFLILGQMTTADPSRSPEGTESAWAYTHVPRGQRWTVARLRRFADKMEKIVEQHAPGFTGLIRGRFLQGPVELEDADANLVEGAVNGGSAAVHQQLFFRPVPGLARADTPVDRLFLAGASAHPGGSVHGAPGANAARAALARHGVAGGLYRWTVDTLHRSFYG
ncbi:phytoene desaturase family protein [Amycolatopsis suaedae]|uniref:Pyridine nucleotide-disulfide oxidoreductase domain-containing protein 2 n=1 Tax=Amycolatopsis suaedae TaxID=2510978 RepID=A0A4Q7JAA7_9PSEU|nr:NAD(P)/FAD-dependent oxidoreductase [Amycolatopsis suaedae]RZQ63896.1 NAD(P)/FAD-dependent oxidoreductase [Amycolatopsis suaedae]